MENKVINLMERQKQKHAAALQAAETARLKEFYKQYFADQPKELIQEIYQAIEARDFIKYQELTEPIIMRQVIQEFNTGKLTEDK